MNEDSNGGGAPAPTAEVLAGRLLRLLRQGRGWSQKEVADRMRAYGYAWNQSTITRIESASRPLRVNELADLALLFGVPVAQLLEPNVLLGERDDIEDLEREIVRLEGERQHLIYMRDQTREAQAAASHHAAEVATALARVEASLEALRRWHPQAVKKGGAR